MTTPTDSPRQRLRDTIVDAARARTIAAGWDAVRMGGVATTAGVSRQTVYNEFGSKAGLAEALARAEVDRFVGDVRAALDAHGSDVRAGAYAAIAHTLATAADNPLVKAILTSARGGSDELLPYLTTRAEVVLTEASGALIEWADDHLPGADRAALTFAADTVVRLVVSHIVLPRTPIEQTAEALADLAVRLFAAATHPTR
ncbi:TetR/AcrR family transcriptional regulator [Micromonospora parathelypteridis]|uniref:AcrR family transcriptional regulator n=1 Tax=Micromonospora parathelypteridis TaxID=1839617 RepID=A0A840VSC9_9ACTN|nr:TetR family transcriptional regulator [Micromonospora parathelypteridis]MBB5479605.1 AcrR family transcriptional regulator [Micromonospora parathelypteridis]GGO30786.1 putative transcriptional regulator, TetR family protein [Micromonospora parathelypteridis]